MTGGPRRISRSRIARQTPSTGTDVRVAAPAAQPTPAVTTPSRATTDHRTRSGSQTVKPPANTANAATGEIAGVDAGAATRSGADTRKRGWFWHWNSIVTQFAPLIGLKGVGLLNSYTVWTDRREDSPNRGYAFPSQQSEADFYGEERAELITINKILVALDLIEIRKEMIVKPDAQGRRWKVPHNFYRVKDHDDGYMLTAPRVLDVVHLADTDRNVYRYLRRVFSGRFRPIDGDSVWHQILPELRRDPTWQRLATKVEREEQRASDRTRAGHAARQQAAGTALFSVPDARDSEAGNDTDNDIETNVAVIAIDRGETSVANTNGGFQAVEGIDVAFANNGLMIDDERGNDGLAETGPGIAAATNRGRSTVVAPTNTTYDQDSFTTRTMTTARNAATTGNTATPQPTPQREQPTRTVRKIQARRNATGSALTNAEDPRGRTGQTAGHPGSVEHERPVAGAGPDAGTAALQAFSDANDKAPTTAQRQLLARLADEFDGAARSAGTTGWAWVTAAIYEAVESGSAFVAPRRIREILNRWQRDGMPGGDDDSGRRSREAQTSRGRSGTARGSAAGARSFGVSAARTQPAAAPVARQSARTGASAGRVPQRAQVGRGPDRSRVPIAPVPAPLRPAGAATRTNAPAGFVIPECGLLAPGVWAAIMTELALDGEIPRADLDGLVRPASLIGRGDAGELVIGATTMTAQRRLTARYLPALSRAAEVITGAPLGVIVVNRDHWLAEHPDRGLGGQDTIGRASLGG